MSSADGNPKTIGLLADQLMTWGGGRDFFSMIVDGLTNSPWQPKPRYVLFVNTSPSPTSLKEQAYHALINSGLATLGSRLGRKSFAQVAGYFDFDQLDQLATVLGRSIPIRLYRNARHLDNLCRSMRVDCLFPISQNLAPDIKTPFVGYIPDLQHKYLPEYFSDNEIEMRDREFNVLANNANLIVVNSRHTAISCQQFLANTRATFIPLPFAAAPKADWLEDQHYRLSKYNLPSTYFLVSNQFWIHKNHQVIFKAFKDGLESGWPDTLGLVCTGSTDDYRHPEYFNGLKNLLAELGLNDRVRILGHIPKRDQIEIMKNAIAVIQPTLFEGGPGGGSVYDAISIGIPAILSDIEINRELDCFDFDLHFFPPHDHVRLSSLMNSFVQSSNRKGFSSLELIDAGNKRRRKLGVVLASAVEAAEAARLNAD
jgi:glycosyltransferase involved in cell wall biosynthesis